MGRHLNAMGQPCDGVLCTLCTRCSNCRHQKPGTYSPHEHTFTQTQPHPALVAPKPVKKVRAKRPKTGATV